MRKFTLFFASLFITISAMAQEPVVTVTEIGDAPYQLNDEDATKIFELDDLTIVLDVTTASTLSERGAFFCVADPAQAVPESFSGTNTSYMACGHNGSAIAYIAAAKSGQHFSSGTIPTGSTIRLAFVLDKTNNLFKSYIGNSNTDWTMNRSFGSYEIATPKMVKEDFENAKIYIGGGMAGNASQEICDATIHDVRIYSGALTIEEIKALPKIHVTEIAEFENGKIYTFASIRGKMGATEDKDNTISTARTSVSDTGTDFFKWTVYKSANENYYLYNIGKGMFMGVQSSNNSSIPFADTPQGSKLTFKKSSNAGYPIMFSTDNAGVVNHSTSYGDGLITWTGGWNKLDDAGSNHRVTLIDNLDETTLTTIAELVAEYETDNTEAVAALQAAIDAANAMNDYIGTGVGKYTYTGEGTFAAAVAEYQTYIDAIESTNTPTPAEIEAKTIELNTLVASLTLNMPEKGKYYRIKDYDTDNYLLSDEYSDTRLAMGNGEEASAIFYYGEDGSLLSYAIGRYLPKAVAGGDWTCLEIGVAGPAATFGAGYSIGAYGFYVGDASNRAYYSGRNTYVDAGGTIGSGTGYDWYLEEVTTLPVTITAAKYATLYAPVALEIPGGVTAYTASISGNYAVLTEISGVIPAETGVVLAGEANTYDFTITTAEEGEKGDLKGSAATTYNTEAGTYYALAIVDNVVGFYKDAFSNSRFQNNSHKAYLYVSTDEANAIASYSFSFDWGGTTGIENIEDAVEENAAKAIYDITGRQIKAITVPGIYIINGKKTFVK